MAKATPANLPSSLRAQRSSEVHLPATTSKSKQCLFKLCLPIKSCNFDKVLEEGLEDMPAKRTAALEAVSPILLVATLFCNIQMTWEVFDSMLSSMWITHSLECLDGLSSWVSSSTSRPQ